MKTGHTEDSGYGLTASTIKGGRRLILVINGLDSKKARSEEAERLLDWGYREYNNYALFKASEKAAKASVWLGNRATVPLLIEKDLEITMPRRARRNMKVSVNYQNIIAAPIAKGDKLGNIVITAPGLETIEIPLVAGESAERLGFIGRLGALMRYIVFGISG